MKKSKKIKNGLKACINDATCCKCPYYSEKYSCISSLFKDALKYIKKLEK